MKALFFFTAAAFKSYCHIYLQTKGARTDSFIFERRRRDLNPRAAINDLLPFQGSPFGQLGYFSKMSTSQEFTIFLNENQALFIYT